MRYSNQYSYEQTKELMEDEYVLCYEQTKELLEDEYVLCCVVLFVCLGVKWAHVKLVK
jgi:hypothetical protein